MSEGHTRYQLRERIAIGGTAEVFRATFLTRDGSASQVVIKRVLPQFARDERFRRLFHEEACVAATISHPNIVRVLDHGEMGQTCFIALELVEGRDLGRLLDLARASGRLPLPQQAAFIAERIAEALQFIHDQTSSEGTPLRIIHRDVSPQNILLSFQGDVKLTDFGIAKSAIRQERTIDGSIRGKLEYMAPEQATLTEVDGRADIFALGCVLYTMLGGKPPFAGENEAQVLERLRQNQLVLPIDELPAPVPLRHVLQRALAHDREQRYQRAGEMAAELRAFLATDPEPLTSEQLSRWVRQLEQRQSIEQTGAVDAAVRQLFGDDQAPPPSATTVFASTTCETAAPVERTVRARVRARRGGAALALITVLGLCGWLLWALNAFSPRERPPRPAPGAAPGESRARSLAELAPPAADLKAGPDALAPAPAFLTVNSTPPGAQVLLDGRPAGKTPLELRPPDRPFSLELRRRGYQTISRELPAGGGTRQLSVTLAPRPARAAFGTLTINSMPWSQVRLNGRLLGNTPLVKRRVPAGNHRLELRGADGSRRKTLTLSLAADEHRSLSFDFSR